jgi:hypothetical protein
MVPDEPTAAIADPAAASHPPAEAPAQDQAAARHLAAHRDEAFAEPDGSGRPPADRATVEPPNGQEASSGPADPKDRTIYQRTGSSLRRRLRSRGQDPTQRGR